MSENSVTRSGKIVEPIPKSIPSLDIDTLNIIGNSYKGTAFVPQHVSSHSESDNEYNTFSNIFGNNIQNKYKNLKDEYDCYVDSQAYEASRNWFDSGGQQLSFTRVLGIGSGKANSEGIYENSGFNVSKPIYSGSIKSGNEYINPNSKAGGIEGSVNFILKSFANKTLRGTSTPNSMELDPFRNYKNEELGIGGLTSKFITDIVLCPSGVLPTIHSNLSSKQIPDEFEKDIETSSNLPDYNNSLKNQQSLFSFENSINGLFGYPLGQINSVHNSAYSEDFYLYLNGLNNQIDDSINNIVKIKKSTNSFIKNNEEYRDEFSKNYYSKRILEKGHFFYASYQNNKTLQTSPINADNISNISIFTALKKSTVDAQTGGEVVPDYNDFTSKYKTALTPWITSQPLNRVDLENNREKIHEKVERLFRFYAISDGASGNKYRIKICPKRVYDKFEDKYSIFDIFIFEYNVANNTFILLESYKDLDLNPDSINYIERKIGSTYSYYDFKIKKVCTKGDFDNVSRHLRVEVSNLIKERKIEKKLVPCGFESYPHINFKKEAFNSYKTADVIEINNNDKFNSYFTDINQMPMTFVPNYVVDESITEDIGYLNSWGPLFFNIREVKSEITKKFRKSNGSIEDFRYIKNQYLYLNDSLSSITFSPHYFYTKYFQTENINTNKNFLIEENNWLNSFFHLEKILYPIHKIANIEKIAWNESIYLRSGKQITSSNFHHSLYDCYRYVNIDELLNTSISKSYVKQNASSLSFDIFTYGGFDGTNILDKDKSFFNNNAISREKYREDFSSTRNAYESAIDVSTKYENCLNDIFIIPGISDINIISKVIDKASEENRFIFSSDVRATTVNKEISGDFFRIINKVNDTRNNSIELNIENRKISYRENEILNFKNNYKNFLGSDYSSRFFFPVIGEIYDAQREFILCPTIYTSGLMIREISSSINKNSAQYSLGTSLVDNENFKLSDEDFAENTDNFRKNCLNILYEDNSPSATGIKLFSANTTFSRRDSAYRQLSTTRVVNLIKKKIEFDLILNTDSILFQLNSSINDLYKLTENRLRIIMNGFVNDGIINSFYVSVPKLTISGLNTDLLNNILRIKVFIQLVNAQDQKDKVQEITLGDLNKEIKSLTNLSENLQLINI